MLPEPLPPGQSFYRPRPPGSELLSTVTTEGVTPSQGDPGPRVERTEPPGSELLPTVTTEGVTPQPEGPGDGEKGGQSFC